MRGRKRSKQVAGTVVTYNSSIIPQLSFQMIAIVSAIYKKKCYKESSSLNFLLVLIHLMSRLVYKILSIRINLFILFCVHVQLLYSKKRELEEREKKNTKMQTHTGFLKKSLLKIYQIHRPIFMVESLLLSRFIVHPMFMQIWRKLQRRFERAPARTNVPVGN